MPTAEVDGVQVDSRDGTVEDLTASLTPPAETKPVGPAAVTQTTEEGTPQPAAKTTEEPDTASDAGKTLAGKRTALQARIDTLTFEKHEERRERERLEARLAALEGEKAPVVAKDDKPRLKTFTDKIGTDYDDYESAVEAHAEALTDYKLAARDTASNASSQNLARSTAMHTVYTRGVETHADFDAILGQFVQEGGRLAPQTAAEAQGPLGDLEAVILQHPLGHSIAYEFAKDADLRGRLLGANSRVLFMTEMGKLLTRLEGAPAGSPPKAAPVSKAQPPVKPVVGAPKATDGPPGDDASDDEWRIYENAQELARRRRA